ncbi:MerR family transcriptional regulator [Streptomyces sp. NBC_01465]|uniref:MerR family transcriptional regulator n=1 Tax=Streptomyces sp. NBC_01465 TaxID=2903878 RepID=UPI002E2EC3E4|nr:MerR family transcriptional regulator [Streptomyces sp. NBC_01465]
MRLAELSERSGVSTATIKYYLRQGMLAPGRKIGATTADYDESHVRRLRLVRALIEVGRLPVATAKEVIGYIDDDSLDQTMRLGAALWALPHGPEPDETDPSVVAAAQEVDSLLETLGWSTAREVGALSPDYRALVVAVTTLSRLGYPWGGEMAVPYAELMHQAAIRDLDYMDTHSTETEKVETAVAATVLIEPVLRSLRRLAQAEEAARRYGL